MTKDSIEGFMFGLGAGFLIAHFLKPPEEQHAQPEDHYREGELKGPGSEDFLRHISAAAGAEQLSGPTSDCIKSALHGL